MAIGNLENLCLPANLVQPEPEAQAGAAGRSAQTWTRPTTEESMRWNVKQTKLQNYLLNLK